jgi:hypothetical protein
MMTAKISFGPDFWDPAGIGDKNFRMDSCISDSFSLNPDPFFGDQG